MSLTSKRKDVKSKLTGFDNPGASEDHFSGYTQHIAYRYVLVSLVNISGFALQRRSLTKLIFVACRHFLNLSCFHCTREIGQS